MDKSHLDPNSGPPAIKQPSLAVLEALQEHYNSPDEIDELNKSLDYVNQMTDQEKRALLSKQHNFRYDEEASKPSRLCDSCT